MNSGMFSGKEDVCLFAHHSIPIDLDPNWYHMTLHSNIPTA